MKRKQTWKTKEFQEGLYNFFVKENRKDYYKKLYPNHDFKISLCSKSDCYYMIAAIIEQETGKYNVVAKIFHAKICTKTGEVYSSLGRRIDNILNYSEKEMER